MPSYKLHYFNIPGRAEVIRLLFNYGKVPFEDVRVPKDEWVKLKPTTPFGQLPVLEIDGVLFGQSNAIIRYVANLVGLDGKSAKENLAIDVVVEALADLQKGGMDIRMAQDETKKAELKTKFEEKLSFTLNKLDEGAAKNNGYLALPRITWADVLFVNGYESLRNVLNRDILSPYANLQKVKQNVLSQEGIKNWIKNRPENPMKPSYDLKQDL